MHLAASRRETEASDLVEGLRFSGCAYIDENDGLHIELAPFVKSLLHDDVEISRIKKCANRNCQRIFWAGRIDQKGCPVPDGKLTGCGHAYRNQLCRDEKKRSEENRKAQPMQSYRVHERKTQSHKRRTFRYARLVVSRSNYSMTDRWTAKRAKVSWNTSRLAPRRKERDY